MLRQGDAAGHHEGGTGLFQLAGAPIGIPQSQETGGVFRLESIGLLEWTDRVLVPTALEQVPAQREVRQRRRRKLLQLLTVLSFLFVHAHGSCHVRLESLLEGADSCYSITCQGSDMRETRFGTAALAVAMVFAGCATDKKVQASSEVIYEEADAGSAAAASADPFSGCEAKQQPPAVILSCGQVVAAFIQLPQTLNAAQIEQNFKGFEGSFPEQSTRERFTQKVGDMEASGARVHENSPVAPFRSDLLIVPLVERGTLVLSCRVTGSIDWTRCGKIIDELAVNGVPPRVPGAPQPSAGPVDGGTTSGATVPSGSSTDSSSGTTRK